MSGKGFEKRNGDWRCCRCNYSNFNWRQQCNRCRAWKSGKRNKEEGPGVGTALLVGAGAAAVGFLAQGLWNMFQGQSTSPSAPSPPSPSSGAGNIDDVSARMRQRSAFRDQDVPKEMKCAVCLLNPREVCMLPCGCVYLCEDCAQEVKTKCPMCQQAIESKKAIYL